MPFRKSTFREYSLITSEAGLLKGSRRKSTCRCGSVGRGVGLGAPTLTLLGLSGPAACLPGHPHTGREGEVSGRPVPQGRSKPGRGLGERRDRERRNQRGEGHRQSCRIGRAWPMREAVGRETRTSGASTHEGRAPPTRRGGDSGL